MALPSCRICGRQVVFTSRGTPRHADGLPPWCEHEPEIFQEKDKSMTTGWKIFLFIAWPAIAIALLGFTAILLVVGWFWLPFAPDDVLPPRPGSRSRVYRDDT